MQIVIPIGDVIIVSSADVVGTELNEIEVLTRLAVCEHLLWVAPCPCADVSDVDIFILWAAKHGILICQVAVGQRGCDICWGRNHTMRIQIHRCEDNALQCRVVEPAANLVTEEDAGTDVAILLGLHCAPLLTVCEVLRRRPAFNENAVIVPDALLQGVICAVHDVWGRWRRWWWWAWALLIQHRWVGGHGLALTSATREGLVIFQFG